MTTLRTGDSARQKFDTIQSRIAELTAQRATVASADLPLDELRERCVAAERNIRAPLANIKTRLRQLRKPGPTPALIQKDDDVNELAALFAHLADGNLIATRLFERESSDAQYAPGLPTAERTKLLAEIDASLHEQRIAEEVEACRLEAIGGTYVMRRPINELDIQALVEAWDLADTTSAEVLASIPRYISRVADGGAPDWMQGGD